jgi:aminopeptidase N
VRNLRSVQFPEDAGSMAHPVRPDHYVEINNFYTATVYEKGAEVVGMYQTLLGREGFAKGMRLYFERHDGQAVTCDDFAQAMADANPGSALSAAAGAFKRWYSQPGTPQVAATRQLRRRVAPLQLTLTQRNGKATEPQLIPLRMGLVGAEGQQIALQLEGELATPWLRHRAAARAADADLHTSSTCRSNRCPRCCAASRRRCCWTTAWPTPQLLNLLRHDSRPLQPLGGGQRLALKRLLRAARSGQRRCNSTTPTWRRCAPAARPATGPRLQGPGADACPRRPTSPSSSKRGPAGHPRAVEAAWNQLATALREDWEWAFEAHQVRGGYSPQCAEDAGKPLAQPTWRWPCWCADATTEWRRALARPRLPACQGRRQHDRALRRAVGPGQRTRGVGRHRAGPLPRSMFAHDALVIDKWFMLQARAPERDGKVFERAKQAAAAPGLHAEEPEPRAQPAGAAVQHEPRRLPPRRRRRLRVLGRAGGSASTPQPAARQPPGARDGPLGAAGRALPRPPPRRR